MNRTQQQLAELPIPGGWRWQTVTVRDQHWKVLLPADGDAFLTEPAAEDNWPDPYWTQIWPAARTLAELVLGHAWKPGTRVLELGCGNGLVGLAALARGCQVTFSDYVPLAVELAVANARGNGYAAVRGEVLDWRTVAPAPEYEFLLAADVLYDPELHEPLLNTLRARLSAVGMFWLGDPGRGETAQRFLNSAVAAGWRLELYDEHHQPVTALARGEFRLIRGSLSRESGYDDRLR